MYSSDNSSNIGIGSCPTFFGNEACENVYSNLTALDYQCQAFCSNNLFFGYRTGRLCGSCIPGTAVAINNVIFLSCVNYTCSTVDCFFPRMALCCGHTIHTTNNNGSVNNSTGY